MKRLELLILLVLASAGLCPAALLTLPQDCAVGGVNSCVSEEGNSATGILFDNPSNTRVQLAFVAADFVAAGCAGSCVLSSISFRLDNFQAALAPTNVGSVDIYLSEVASARSNANGLGLANAFAANIDAASRLQVFSGPLTLSSAAGSGSPNAFNLGISFQTAYTYAATADLLVDIIWTGGYTRIFRSLDATTLETGVDASAVGYANAGASTGSNGSLSTNRIVAQFDATPVAVPEPGAASLALAGLGWLGWKQQRRRNFLLAGAGLASLVRAVEPGKPSRTALMAAAARAIASRDPNPQTRCPDSLAARLISGEDLDVLTGSSLPALYNLPWAEVMRRESASGRYPFLYTTLRTMHFDAKIREALAAGLDEIVILGAGLDSRAYRMKEELAKVRLFEVDYPPTQEDKKRRVRAALGKVPEHVTYVGIDFSKQSLDEVLAAAGHQRRSRTLFVMEAVTVYLSPDAVSTTLRAVSKNTAPGGGILFDYYDRRLQEGEGQTPYYKSNTALYRSWGEPQIYGIPAYELPQFLDTHGLALRSDHTLGEMCALYTPRLAASSVDYRRLYYHIAHAVVA